MEAGVEERGGVAIGFGLFVSFAWPGGAMSSARFVWRQEWIRGSPEGSVALPRSHGPD